MPDLSEIARNYGVGYDHADRSPIIRPDPRRVPWMVCAARALTVLFCLAVGGVGGWAIVHAAVKLGIWP